MRLPILLLALTLGITAAGCSRSDSDVQADLQKQLAADTATSGITATVTEGVARLSGVTKTKAQQDRALDIARSVKGVKEVQSTLRMDDATLADEVKKTIALYRKLFRRDIDGAQLWRELKISYQLGVTRGQLSRAS